MSIIATDIITTRTAIMTRITTWTAIMSRSAATTTTIALRHAGMEIRIHGGNPAVH